MKSAAGRLYYLESKAERLIEKYETEDTTILNRNLGLK